MEKEEENNIVTSKIIFLRCSGNDGFGGQVWWGSTVWPYEGEVLWVSMVGKYGEEVSWGSMVGKYGGEVC